MRRFDESKGYFKKEDTQREGLEEAEENAW